MAEATPPDWRDTCEHCGRAFDASEPRWLEQRRHFVHTECARWERWETPPYVWKLKELRKLYRDARAEVRPSIAHAGRTIREMERAWPADAANHVRRVLVAVRRVG
jgi:hypothetical protein